MKILITGVSGLLGLNAAVALRGAHVVVGSYMNQPVRLPGVAARRLDVLDPDAVRAWIAAERPDLVLHTAGFTNVEGCEADPALAKQLNVDAAGHVASAAAEAGAALLHISTDHLFDGTGALYSEDAPTSPVNIYARTKLEAESVVARAHPRAFIIRTNFYGWGHPRRRSFSEWIILALRRGEELTMFQDVHFTPMCATDLIAAALDLVARAAPGIYNVAGGERLSKYAFAMTLAERFALDARLVRPVSVDTFAFKARRPRDMSLDTSKAARALGAPMGGVAAGITRLAELERDGLPAVLAGAVAMDHRESR